MNLNPRTNLNCSGLQISIGWYGSLHFELNVWTNFGRMKIKTFKTIAEILFAKMGRLPFFF